MYEDSPGSIGSLTCSDERRRELASKSVEFNRRNMLFCSMFSDELGAESLLNQKDNNRDNINNDDDGEPCCRFCYDEGGLVNPCACTGTAQWVHELCLRQWQRSVLLTQSTHPKYQRRIDEYCDICGTKFKPGFEPLSRHQSILQFTSTEVARCIRQGTIVVSTARHSEDIDNLMSTHKNESTFVWDLAHWCRSVMIITNQVDLGLHSQSEEGSGVLALNFGSEKLNRPPVLQRGVQPSQRWKHLSDSLPESVKSVAHYVGGPCDPSQPFGVIALPDRLIQQYETNGTLIMGRFYIAELNKNFFKQIPIECDHLKVVWGFAGWGSTQFLAEVAKRSWGLVNKDDGKVNFTNWDYEMSWNVLERGAKVAPESEYSKN